MRKNYSVPGALRVAESSSCRVVEFCLSETVYYHSSVGHTVFFCSQYSRTLSPHQEANLTAKASRNLKRSFVFTLNPSSSLAPAILVIPGSKPSSPPLMVLMQSSELMNQDSDGGVVCSEGECFVFSIMYISKKPINILCLVWYRDLILYLIHLGLWSRLAHHHNTHFLFSLLAICHLIEYLYHYV